MFVVELLRNGSTDPHEILWAYRVGLRIGQHLFFIPLNGKGGSPLNFFLFFRQNFLFLFFYEIAFKNTYNPKFWLFDNQPLFLFGNYKLYFYYDLLADVTMTNDCLKIINICIATSICFFLTNLLFQFKCQFIYTFFTLLLRIFPLFIISPVDFCRTEFFSMQLS